jgi:luciferase family oxidoreductase group 1
MKTSLLEVSRVPAGTTHGEALEGSIALSVHAETIGMSRVWFSEHHILHSLAGHNPELLIAAVSQHTNRIRLGSGAVLLNHYSPFKVAEVFHGLEALAPGRIDLGIGRATAGPIIDAALRRDRRAPLPDDFDQQVQEILGFHHAAFATDHPFSQIPLAPFTKSAPEAWVLGSSGNSAGLAGALGLGYAFSGFINPAGASTAFSLYRQSFAPSRFGAQQPRTILALLMSIADTDAEARRLAWPTLASMARLRQGGLTTTTPTQDEATAELTDAQKDEPTTVVNGVIPRLIAGSTRTVATQLEYLAETTGADEVMIIDAVPEFDQRRSVHELLADITDASPEIVHRSTDSARTTDPRDHAQPRR